MEVEKKPFTIANCVSHATLIRWIEICHYCSKRMRKGYWKKKTYNFIKKRLPLRCFSVNFAKMLRSFFYIGCFWNILFTCSYYETQIKSRVLPSKKQNRGNLNNQIYYLFWNIFLLNVDIWLLKLRMQACKISLTTIGKTRSISCFSFALIVNYRENFIKHLMFKIVYICLIC